MKVLLKLGWEAKISTIKSRVYILGNKSRQLVNKIFDKMYCLGRIKFTTKHTPFSFPVFVVWKTNTKSKRKSRAIVDIWRLNEIVLFDSYSLPL